MSVPNDSSRRAFFCQESLWQAYVDLATRRGTSVDALINDAMGQYLYNSRSSQEHPAQFARQSYVPGASGSSSSNLGYQGASAQAHEQDPAPHQVVSQAPQASYGGNVQWQQQVAPAPQSVSPVVQGGRVPPPVPNSHYRRPPSIFEEINAPPAIVPGVQPLVLASLNAQQSSRQANYAQPVAQPQVFAQQQAYAQAQGYTQPPLYIFFANQKYIVDKDKYIIGRSSQLADLVIRDGNVSRKHCAIIFKNGAYYITDLDSTNGIEYRGNRIETKRIDEGDQFNICEFNFTFTSN